MSQYLTFVKSYKACTEMEIHIIKQTHVFSSYNLAVFVKLGYI